MIMLLTFNSYTSILNMHSKKTSVGFSSPFSSGAIAMCHLVYGFFIAYLIVMVGVLGGFKPAGSRTRSTNLMHSPPKSLVAFGGDFKIIVLEAIMPLKKHNQKLTNNVSKKSQSRFNVLTRSGRSIARRVPFSTAIRLKSGQPSLTIKFSGMEVSI